MSPGHRISGELRETETDVSKRFLHRGDMLRRCSATSADNICARFTKGERILAEILRIGGIHNASADLLGPACVRLDPEFAIGHSLVHLLENAQQLRGSAGTIDADHIRACFCKSARHFRRVIAKQGAVIACECDGSDNRQVEQTLLSQL